MTGIKSLLYGEYLLFTLMFLSVVGQRFQWIPFKLAFGSFALSTLLVTLAALVGLIMFSLSFGVLSTEVRGTALLIFVSGISPVVMILMLVGPGLKVPRIHDISTDTDNNIAFVHAHTLRSDTESSLEIPEAKISKLQTDFYRDISPLRVKDNPTVAFEKALEVALNLGWRVTYRDPENTFFEALEKTLLFGFTDDIAIRVAEDGDGARIDMRSVSRVGQSDLGANAKRILRFQETYRSL